MGQPLEGETVAQEEQRNANDQERKQERKGRGWNPRFLLLLFAFAAGCAAALVLRPRRTEPISRSDFLLNTFITITLYDCEEEEILDGAVDLCREYEERFSKTISSSEIYRINHRAEGEDRFQLSEETAKLIAEGLYYSELSDGAYDLTIEPLSTLWNFSGGRTTVPPREEIEAAAARVDWRRLRLEGNCLTLLTPDVTLDLGSIAKGYIADRIKEYLLAQGVESATINLGGNVLCVGEKPSGEPFYIGLQKPFDDRNEIVANLEIRDASVVTSGVYERHFVENGVNYHHLLDPKTGYPYENGLISVTIVSPLSVDGDALSTTCFALGLEEGMALVDGLPDTYGYFITDDYEMHYSEGAEKLVKRD